MRTRLLISFFSIIWLSLLVRVFYLSVQSNSYYATLSSHNTIKTEMIAPIRGEIHDRNNEPIAINKLGFSIKLQPHLKKKGEESELDKTILGNTIFNVGCWIERVGVVLLQEEGAW